MNIQIFSKEGLSNTAEAVYDHCISIGDPQEELPEGMHRFKSILRLEFHDEVEESEGQKLFDAGDAHRIVDFYNTTRNKANGYTLHCHAGISRSTATALIVLYLIYGSEDQAMGELLKIHPAPLPNRRILRVFDEHFGSDLALIGEKLRDHYHDNLKRMMDEELSELPMSEEDFDPPLVKYLRSKVNMDKIFVGEYGRPRIDLVCRKPLKRIIVLPFDGKNLNGSPENSLYNICTTNDIGHEPCKCENEYKGVNADKLAEVMSEFFK